MLPDIEEISQNLTQQKPESLPREYQEYLDRIEQDYLSACFTFTIIRDLLLTATANSANISMCLLLLNCGLGAFSAGIVGFVLGAIPAIIDIKSANIDLVSEYKVRDISRLVFGGVKLITSAGIAYNTTREYRQLMNYAKESIRNFEIEVKNYEIRVQPTDNLSIALHLQIVIGASCLLALLPLIFRLFRRY